MNANKTNQMIKQPCDGCQRPVCHLVEEGPELLCRSCAETRRHENNRAMFGSPTTPKGQRLGWRRAGSATVVA